MVSHAYPEQTALVAEVCQSFVFDNGAFTMWKGGRKPIWDDYAQWVKTWAQHPGFDWCLIPDVIDGSEEDNDELIQWWERETDNFIPSVPIWHLHESLDRLEMLVDDHRRVALGSSGDYATIGTKKWWNRIAEAMSRACDGLGQPKTKLHGLRMLDPTIFSHIPFSSADSTNVAQNVGIDKKWKGPYEPMSKEGRALVMADRIEHHASASRWTWTTGLQSNFELIG